MMCDAPRYADLPADATLCVDVFTMDGRGGNPCPIVRDATAMDAPTMQAIARAQGHEAAFVQPQSDAESDFSIRFFVPEREVEMCGHATLGSLWLLRQSGMISDGLWRVRTRSGIVHGRVEGLSIQLSQPAATIEVLDIAHRAPLLDCLGLVPEDLASPQLCNASTSRSKTLIQLASASILNRLQPRWADVRALCEQLGSTGLYPFAQLSSETSGTPARVFEARQFPCASGYPEDAATGIAATALAGALSVFGLDVPPSTTITVIQGRAMGRPSRLHVMPEEAKAGAPERFWLGGDVTPQINFFQPPH
ncbi:PhzF family phenazine biosynthesis protein [Burkholderia gladioli]|uniref:PhzF family phenazine biosynthesis protein n=1 Tax=Burkholderia gladioli TaxID=28095 RepID=UPI001641D33E|nr:PhzF family phenazine biosynthesis protein [Burkholderia gladioli]